MVHNWDIWGFDSVQNCPCRTGFKHEAKTFVQKVKDVKGFVCVKGHPCKIVEMRTPAAGKRQFIAIDIFNGKVFKATFPKSENCVVPVVTLTDYQLVYISEEDSHVGLLDDKGNIKGDLKLPTDQDLLSQIKFEFAEGNDVFVCVASAMGKEEIIASRRRSLLQRY